MRVDLNDFIKYIDRSNLGFNDITKARNIIKYIQENIQPIYLTNRNAHGWDHIEDVLIDAKHIFYDLYDSGIQNDGTLNEINLVLAVVYHDISLSKNGFRETHAEDSAEIFRNDEYIKSVLDEKSINDIYNAILLHRASSGAQHRSLLGKILYQADRCFYSCTPLTTFKRSFMFNKSENPDLPHISISKLTIDHLVNKYGNYGYAYNDLFLPKSAMKYKEAMKEFIEVAKLLLGN